MSTNKRITDEELEKLRSDLEMQWCNTLEKLIASHRESQELFKEIDSYLDINDLTSIGHYSILHQKVKSILTQPEEE